MGLERIPHSALLSANASGVSPLRSSRRRLRTFHSFYGWFDIMFDHSLFTIHHSPFTIHHSPFTYPNDYFIGLTDKL